MSLYQQLLTTCKPTILVDGTEGFVDSVVEFIKKIIQKILDGIKWVWNLITGGGQGESVAETSAKVDKAVTEAPRKLTKVQEDTKKLYENIKKNKAKASPESKEAGRRIEEILSKRGQSGKTTGELLDEFNKAMSGEGEDGDQKLTWVVKDIKETNTAFAKIMTDNGIKTRDMKSVKEGAAIIVAAALQDKPLPKKDINDMYGRPSITVPGLWFARSESVLRSPDEDDGLKFKKIDVVNQSLADGFKVLHTAMEDQIKLLKSIKLIPLKTLESTAGDARFEALKNLSKDDLDFRDNWVGITYRFAVDRVLGFVEKPEKSGRVGISHTKPRTVSEIYVGVNYKTFTLINTYLKESASLFAKYELELSRITKFMESEKAQLNKLDLEKSSDQVFKMCFDSIDNKLKISSSVVSLCKSFTQQTSDFAAAPMAWLE